MTYSPLTNEVMPPTGRYNGGVKYQARPAGVRINGLNVHHHAATSEAGIYRLVTSSDPASANYIIRNNGSLIGSVPEEYRAWTTSAYANDDDKITVEIQNETGAPDWRISDAAMLTLIRLYADLAKRYGFAPVRANLKGHQEYGIATACPGPYLLPRLDDVSLKAAALGATTTAEDTMADLTPQNLAQIAAAVWGHTLTHAGMSAPAVVFAVDTRIIAGQAKAAAENIAVTLTDDQVAALAAVLGPEVAGHVAGVLAGLTTVSDVRSTVSTTLIPAV